MLSWSPSLFCLFFLLVWFIDNILLMFSKNFILGFVRARPVLIFPGVYIVLTTVLSQLTLAAANKSHIRALLVTNTQEVKKIAVLKLAQI